MANNDIRNAKQLATFIREEDLDDLGSIKRDLEAKAHQAREDGRVYLLQQYTRLLAIIGPEIKRVERRFERENLAYLRKEGKRLKEELKAQSGPADEA
ncbi:MAG TPA: hypothetical protein VL461_13610 [Dictyobacter sp.]|nr:hypothetical protein [Dictyobacter sp.]